MTRTRWTPRWRRSGGPGAPPPRVSLQPEILDRARVGEALDPAPRRLGDARADAADEALLEDRRHQHVVGDDLLDLLQQRLALAAVELPGLPLEEIVHLRQRAVSVQPALGHERLQTGGRVAGGAGGADQQAAQLLVVPAAHERGALHVAHARADADLTEEVPDLLGQRGVGRQRREVARLE